MVQSQFALSWDSYRSSICSGFSALQQNGEFVDMTLAADGHFVKVHQVLIALSSPYLKELITSVPCQHPVIFLNNVSHKTLCFLLEYMYTGEVLVPAEYLSSFTEAAKSLSIRGLENISSHNGNTLKLAKNSITKENEIFTVGGVKRNIEITTGSSDQTVLPLSAKKLCVKVDKTGTNIHTEQSTAKYDDMHDSSTDFLDYNDMNDSDGGMKGDSQQSSQTNEQIAASSNLQYTVSIRGSLQIILNRYIYNLHSMTTRTGIRRWRCVDYRNNKCSAFVITRGNVVLNRKNLHNHAYHDKKILAKIEKKAVYSALDEVQGYKDKNVKNTDTDLSIDNDEYI